MIYCPHIHISDIPSHFVLALITHHACRTMNLSDVLPTFFANLDGLIILTSGVVAQPAPAYSCWPFVIYSDDKYRTFIPPPPPPPPPPGGITLEVGPIFSQLPFLRTKNSSHGLLDTSLVK